MTSDEEAFREITAQLSENMVVAFSQHKGTGNLIFDLIDVDDYDTAIAMTVKGLFMLCLDALGVWDDGEEITVELDDTDEEEDDEE